MQVFYKKMIMKIERELRKILAVLLCMFFSQHVFAQQREITGMVVSFDTGEPLIGVAVHPKGNAARGVVTDIEGKYVLSVGQEDRLLVFSYLGMKTLEVRIGDKTEINVELRTETQLLDEVVVTGYGNFSRSSFTGSANTLSARMLEEVPVMSVEQKLQGMTTGVNITSSSGQPGANQSIRIRGMGSFNASQEPLFVIDGVPVTSGNVSSGGPEAAYMNNSKTNIMSTISPSDIENITIIKDAAAASLYGSRAANGVILITTKKGTSGRTTVNLNISEGFSNPAVNFRGLSAFRAYILFAVQITMVSADRVSR